MRIAPDFAARKIAEQEDGYREEAVASAFKARRDMIGSKAPENPISFKLHFSWPNTPWDGLEVEAWRAEVLNTFTYALLNREIDPYIDWISPFADLEKIRAEKISWVRLWLDEVNKSDVPRQWIRSAFNAMSRFRRTSAGTVGDIQLATYLPDADLFLYADKLFVELVEICKKDAPCPIAEAELLRGGIDTVDHLFEKLRFIGNSIKQ